ncbi:glutamate receptor 2-like [Parasteatoda tepidariorum]|uniref:glutamate receptor 2-like n=1 Tax=Parasteatoda tepidariorum TaxID=114398 RepID=UPI0039BD6835
MKNLSIAVMRSPIINYTISEQGKHIFSGYEGQYLQVVLDGLGVESEFLKIIVVKSAAEALAVVHEGAADMALTYLVQFYEFLETVDFSMFYTVASFSFGIRKSIPLETKYSFIYPFTLPVWIGCLATAVLLPLVYKFLGNSNVTYLQLFTYFCIGITEHPTESNRKSFRTRILVLSSLIFRLIMTFSYAAILLSFMANPLMNPPIRNFKDLSKATETTGLKAYCVDSTYAKDVFRRANQNQGYIQSLGQYIDEHNYYYWFDSIDYAKTYAEGSAVIMVVPSLLEVESVERYSAFISSDTIGNMLFSAYINKKFRYKKKLNSIISRLWQAGIYRKILNTEAMKVIATHKSSHEADRVRPISVENLFGVFMLLILGYILALFTLVTEVILYKKSVVSS